MTSLARIASALLRGSLTLFPARYRREYGEERACVLELALEEAAAGGWLPLLRFCARELRDLPIALLREHSKDWRRRMGNIQQTTSLGGESMSGRQLLLFLVPFLTVLILPLRTWLDINLWVIPILGLLAAVLILAFAGLVKGLPRWSLPSLGLVISISNLFFLNSLMTWVDPVMSKLKQLLWTDFMPARMLYALIADLVFLTPTFLLLVALALLSGVVPVLSAFRQRLGQDWTLLPFLLYATRLMDPFYADPYRGLEPYQWLFTLILAGGAWFYLQTSQPASRMALLLVATVVSSLVLAVGIYLIYPFQSWVNDAHIDFPRWWEGINPLIGVLAMLAFLYLTAGLGRLLRQEQPVKMTNA